jgi:HSP20 family protein
MSIVRWNPGFPDRSFSRMFDEFFNRNISDFIGGDFGINQPNVNILEEDDKFKIEVAAPGLDKSDFDIKMENGFLTISAQKKDSKEEKEDGKYTRREFNYSYFSRSFQLPEVTDIENIHASYDRGILSVELGKKEEAKAKGPKLIDIK